MKSIWNPNRFLRSVSQSYWGNPQPLRSTRKRYQRMLFNSTNMARTKVRKRAFFIPKSSGLLKGM